MASERSESADLRFGAFTLDLVDARLIGPDGPIHIGRKAFDVLQLLVSQPGQLVTREQMFEQVWNGVAVSESSLTTVIKELRRALGDDSRSPTFIEGVYGRGYRFIATVTAEPRRAVAPALVASKAGQPRIVMWVIAVVAVVATVIAGGVWFAGRDEGPASIAYVGMTGEVAQGSPLPVQIEEALLAGFSTDGRVTIRRVSAPPRRGYSLGGTITHAGDVLKLSVRIENAASRAVLWSRVYEQPAAASDRIATWFAGRTAAVARCGLGAADAHGRPLSDAVMGLVFAECAAQFDGTSPTRALDIARKLTVAQPDLAAGWSAVAWHAGLAGGPSSRPTLSDEQRHAIARALELDPQDSRAWHLRVYEAPLGDLVAAEAAYEKALAARLSICGCVYQDYANFLRAVGRGAQARTMLERAQDVVPLETGPVAGLIQLDAAAGRQAEASRQFAVLAGRELDTGRIAAATVSNALWTRDYAGALDAFPRAGLRMPPELAEAMRAGFQALADDNAAARAKASAAVGDAARRCDCISALSIRMQAALGDTEGAFASMSEAADTRLPMILSTIGWDPMLADVRRLPGFPALAERAGLIRYWRETKTRPDFCAAGDAPAVCKTI